MNYKVSELHTSFKGIYIDAHCTIMSLYTCMHIQWTYIYIHILPNVSHNILYTCTSKHLTIEAQLSIFFQWNIKIVFLKYILCYKICIHRKYISQVSGWLLMSTGRCFTKKVIVRVVYQCYECRISVEIE